MSVYLLHADRPYIPAGCEDRPGCWMRHYLGSADDLHSSLDQRIYEHRSGRGSNVCTVWKRAGIGFELARTWEGGRRRERQIKTGYHFARLCPLCHPMPRINRWEGGQLSPLAVRVKARHIDPVTIPDPWAIPPMAI